MFIVEGLKIVKELMLHHTNLLKQVWCTENFLEELRSINSNRTELCQITNKELQQISNLTTPQPAIALVSIPQATNTGIKSLDELTLALDGIRDPGNLGTIIRLADWFGISHIFCSNDCVDCYNPKVVQATMGAIFRVNIEYCELANKLESIDKKQFGIYGATLNGENIYESEIKNKSILIIGNESNGIRNEILDCLSTEVKIPRFSGNESQTESLNAAIATSVLCAEFKRRMHYSK